MDISEATKEFHRHFYDAAKKGGTWKDTRWLGIDVEKNPLDLWIYQEILHSLRPDLIVEIGTFMGGSALFMASIFDLLGSGRVISVDIQDRPGRPQHSRIEYITGNSVDPSTVERVRSKIRNGEKVLVILDSNHFKDHVLSEMRSYSGMVSVNSYLIVEDGNINGNPVNKEHGPGPAEAITEFLARNGNFVVNRRFEKYYLTFNPGGYLLRVK